MFLTKKGLWKIIAMAICYIALGSICIAIAIAFANLQIDVTMLFVLGIVLYLFCPLLIFWGKYAEGKGKFINIGNVLLRNELKPAEFIKQYIELKNSTDLVINKPSVEVLQLVAIAYDSLDDRENCLSTVDEMIAVAKGKKKTFAKLIKTSYLFSFRMTEEAELLFEELQNTKLNFMCRALIDAIFKTDRAMAMGDYKTVELHCLKMLEQKFPQPDNLLRLVMHFKLGEVYENLQDNKKAIFYYQYCAYYGGETATRESARIALERLK